MARPRKPTAIHLLNGLPGKRPIPANEPHPSNDAIRPPIWLDLYARRIWNRQAPEAIKIGLLTNADVQTFGAYCQAVSDIRRLKADITENGTTMPTKIGLTARPEVRMLENAWARLRAFATDFGFNPSARSKISVAKKVEDPLDALLG